MKEKVKRIDIEKMLVSLILGIWYFSQQQVGYGPMEWDPLVHLQAMVSHANIWHLIGNIFVLTLLTYRLYLVPAVIIGFVASYIPMMGTVWHLIGTEDGTPVVMGFSGVIFAIIGIMWGVQFHAYYRKSARYSMLIFEDFCTRALPWALIGFFIPHICWELHFYSLMIGFAWGIIYDIWQKRKT